MSDLGELLRRARAYKGVSLRDAERATRISRHYLEALEAHDFEKLPPAAYARGIVRNYALYLGLDPQVVLSLYQQACDYHEEATHFELAPATRPMDVRAPWAPNFALIGFMLVVSAIVFAWFYSAYFQPSESVATVTAGQATPTSVDDSLLTLVASQPPATATPDAAALGVLATPTESLTQLDLPTPTAPATATPEVVDEEPTVDETTSDEAATVGEHEFEVVAIDEVWVQVSLDYSDVPAFDGVLGAGESLSFSAGHITVTSGNAPSIEIFVDGESWGILSDQWDAQITYPW